MRIEGNVLGRPMCEESQHRKYQKIWFIAVFGHDWPDPKASYSHSIIYRLLFDIDMALVDMQSLVQEKVMMKILYIDWCCRYCCRSINCTKIFYWISISICRAWDGWKAINGLMAVHTLLLRKTTRLSDCCAAAYAMSYWWRIKIKSLNHRLEEFLNSFATRLLRVCRIFKPDLLLHWLSPWSLRTERRGTFGIEIRWKCPNIF